MYQLGRSQIILISRIECKSKPTKFAATANELTFKFISQWLYYLKLSHFDKKFITKASAHFYTNHFEQNARVKNHLINYDMLKDRIDGKKCSY